MDNTTTVEKNAAEQANGAPRTSFSMSEPLFDESTFYGRFRMLYEAGHPKHAFVSNAEALRQYAIVKAQQQKEDEQMSSTGKPHLLLTEEEIRVVRRAQTISKSAIHPDTGSPIPIPQRFSFFLPGNLPIAMGMLFTAPTMFNTIFWQVINQSYNALLNFGNANKSSPVTQTDIFKSYVMAIISSCGAGAAVRSSTASLAKGLTGSRLFVLNGAVTFIACSIGGFANNWCIRMPERQTGIAVTDPDSGKSYGLSKNCASIASFQTASSRILMAATVLISPTLLFMLERRNLVPKNRHL